MPASFLLTEDTGLAVSGVPRYYARIHYGKNNHKLRSKNQKTPAFNDGNYCFNTGGNI